MYMCIWATRGRRLRTVDPLSPRLAPRRLHTGALGVAWGRLSSPDAHEPGAPARAASRALVGSPPLDRGDSGSTVCALGGDGCALCVHSMCTLGGDALVCMYVYTADCACMCTPGGDARAGAEAPAGARSAAARRRPLHALTCPYMPLHALTYPYIPLRCARRCWPTATSRAPSCRPIWRASCSRGR